MLSLVCASGGEGEDLVSRGLGRRLDLLAMYNLNRSIELKDEHGCGYT